jgi:ribose 5-phosphate isomerase B
MTISIGNDHAGPDYKNAIVNHLKDKGISITNYGTDTLDSVDYPDFVHPVAKDVTNNKVTFGILICGSANGVAMTANKYKNIRAALCWTSEIAAITRLHNDANILCIPARFTSIPQAVKMVDVFLETEFEGGRHQNRIDKMSCQ